MKSKIHQHQKANNFSVSKKIVFIPILFLYFMISAQKCNEVQKTITITQQFDPKQKGTQLVITNVVNDSRCPEGTQCIWEGETELNITIYEKGKVSEEKNLLDSSKTHEKNLVWFATYFPKRKIKNFSILPYPKEGKSHSLKDYIIKVEFQD